MEPGGNGNEMENGNGGRMEKGTYIEKGVVMKEREIKGKCEKSIGVEGKRDWKLR
jgi:hypothetical protein